MIRQAENSGTTDNNARILPVGIVPEDLVQIIWRSRWIVLLIMTMALAIGFAYITVATPIYTSTSRIYVQQSGPNILKEAEGLMTQSKNYLYTQAELLKSTPILSSTLERNDMAQLKIFNKVKNPVAYLKKKGLNVTVGTKDDIIDISSDSPDPVEAALLVNAVVDSYKTYHAIRKRSTSGEVLRILKKEKQDRDEELAKKLKAMMALKSANIGLAFENRNSNIILDRLDTLSAGLTQAELQTVEAKSVYENFRSMMNDPARLKRYADSERAKGIFISNADEWSKLETELEQLQMQLSDLLQQPVTNKSGTNALQTKVKQIENRLAFLHRRFAETQLAIAEQQYNAAKQKQEQIAGYFEAQRQEALQFNKQLAEYTILQSDWEQTKKLCDILDDRIKEINITEDTGSLNISVLETASPADKPSKPPKARYMAIALLFGLVLSGAMALVRDKMDQRLHSMEEITAALRLPSLGTIPSMSRREEPAIRGKKAYLDSKSVWAEAYHTIRTAVLFSDTNAKSRTILVTSPEAGDGKTTVVSNLAIAMAQAGQKTLVLEADFRKPMQNQIFGMNHDDKGLASVLNGAYKLEDVIKTTCVSGLDLLTCGSDVPNPSETLYSVNFNKVMKLLAKQYDRIIVDSPPVLPVTDAQILSSICQITILVLKAEKSTRKASKQTRDALLRVGARILGVVVNDVPKNGRFGYYGGNGYYSESNDTRPGKNKITSVLQKPAIVDKRQELCARLGNSASRRIVEIALPKKKTVVTNGKSAAVMTASDETKNLDDSESKNITERQIMLPERKMVVRRHEEPTKVYDGT
ncbi:MAG: polysaccharide biosynthesis tyrosine autokinase [Sedimentisphaerales bacterium]|nr:polysaccharide biosynthesis tyrosine autokinase [Sedimentisphaerales bacterium]